MTRRETSADSAARFLAMRSGRPGRAVAPSTDSLAAQRLVRWMGAADQLAAAAPRGRVLVDFAMPTLRLIHEVLCDRIAWAEDVGDKLNLLIIAEQMVGAALGEPPAWPEHPPLTDREAGR